MKRVPEILDAIVVGGGPAGLSAALLLGRCRRSVAVFDEGRPRNEMSRSVNSFLGARNISPKSLLAEGRGQLAEFPNVVLVRQRVSEARHADGFFHVRLDSGAAYKSRTLILATGLIDRLPEIPGFAELYGKSVFPCPYCDGWENTGRCLGAFGSGKDAANLALELRLWSDRVSLFLEGPLEAPDLVSLLARWSVDVHPEKVSALKAVNSRLAGVQLVNGRVIPCEALFLVGRQVQHDDFIETIGCQLDRCGQIECGDNGEAGAPGLFVAGNAKEGLQMAMIAAADGIRSAAAANEWLLEQDIFKAS